MQKKQHYYLICAQVAWRVSEDAEDISMMPVNAIAAFDNPFLRHFNLSQINGQMINNLSAVIGQAVKPELVAGVTILSLNQLGYMTEDEFRAVPSETQVHEEVRKVITDADAEDAARAQSERA